MKISQIIATPIPTFETLRDLYSAETQLLGAWPKMAGAAMSLRLKEAFMAHLEETEGHASVIAPSLFTALADWATPRDVTAPFRVEG